MNRIGWGLLLVVAVAGCQSAYYEAAEKVGC
jgi:hypothetical protein